MIPAEFDFRKPPLGQIERNVSAWLTSACRWATEAASGTLPYPATFQFAGLETPTATASIHALPEGAVGIVLATPDIIGTGAALLAFPNPLFLALLSGLVGEAPAELPVGREATPLELSLVPHLVRELFINPLTKSWPARVPPALNVSAPSIPSAVWRAGNERVMVATVTITGPFGTHPVYLMLARTGPWEDLGAAPVEQVAPVPREVIETLVREMNVEMTVVLGKADLTMHDVTSLVPGDVVVFDQKVTQPLEGLVSGTRKFRVWPGVVGDRAAVVVDTITGD
ncbi:Flagellar motor switch protein FliM OS=Moorella thermoacetica (strain ATCC 39073) GN=Moth_0804 PE=4 SV=1: SpoA [Gemmata massiliana]|uniref:Flagellar motor switch protein FliN-like C-terminal domain-containing protein n=1 Tax=Gemmata massiliana TaxID=1210884 RepID=A0A6P2D641_9BACT|nr:flagellar motor switch protein FliM [Gemmata massiliana]VTR96387.1 Flagellar motor switch protein FliM OS=Moorella thermoacetica (strain ATCC 39073) GN=Moth_0804 PE=4 SV=1: SpoA [Gemmata massiliana]